MSSVYIETTIVSYLASRTSEDVVLAGHQQVTRDWWTSRRPLFELFCSAVVKREAAAGDPEAAARRLSFLDGIPMLEITPEAVRLAHDFTGKGALPKIAQEDALHIAIAAAHGIDYLLTWNCKHIANAEIYRAVSRVCDDGGVEAPQICTPDELMGADDET